MAGFKSFLMRGDVVVIAIGLMVALAFSTLIKAFTDAGSPYNKTVAQRLHDDIASVGAEADFGLIVGYLFDVKPLESWGSIECLGMDRVVVNEEHMLQPARVLMPAVEKNDRPSGASERRRPVAIEQMRPIARSEKMFFSNARCCYVNHVFLLHSFR